MIDRFDWEQLLAFAVVHLKLRVNEFWNMLPKQFSVIAQQYNQHEQLEMDIANWRMAMICCIIANANRDRRKKPSPFKPSDFMPEKRQEEKGKKMTDNEMLEVLKNTTVLMGGEVKI